MSTYSVYNIKIDNNLSFPSGVTAGYVLAIDSNGSTYWSAGGSGGGSGSSGTSGSSGVSGSSGSSGTSGVNGATGPAGTGGSGSQTLAQTLALGNSVGGYPIITTTGSISLENNQSYSYVRIGESDRYTTITQGLQGTSGRATILLDGGSQTASIASKIYITSEVTELAGAFRPPAGYPQTDSRITIASQSITLNSGGINNEPGDTQILLDDVNKVINIDASAVNFSANPSYSVALSYNTYLYGLTNSVLAVDNNGKIIATSSSGGSVPTYASYSVTGVINQNLSGVSVTRLKLTGNTSYNFGTASTSQVYSYMVDAGTYKFNLGTYSNYKISPSDFPILGATGAGLSGSFILNGLFDGTSMWIKSELGFFDMPIPSGGGGGGSLATAYIAAITAAGGSIDGTKESAINTFFNTLDTNGITAKTIAMYPYIGSVANSNKINAMNPGTNDITFNGTWVHSATGSRPVSGSGWATNGMVANSVFTTNSSALFTYLGWPEGEGDGTAYMMELGAGSYTDSNHWIIIAGGSQVNGDSNTFFRAYGASDGLYTNGLSSVGLFGMSRTSDSYLSSWKDGTKLSEKTTTLSSSMPSTTIKMPAQGGNGLNWCKRWHKFDWLGQGLTDGEATILSTAINTLQTSLSRNDY